MASEIVHVATGKYVTYSQPELKLNTTRNQYFYLNGDAIVAQPNKGQQNCIQNTAGAVTLSTYFHTFERACPDEDQNTILPGNYELNSLYQNLIYKIKGSHWSLTFS